jgi:Leu/Phe-tRNA-protein transferase
LHISKNSRKKSKHYHLTINQQFDRVIQECHAQHGSHCWLYPSLVHCFSLLQQATVQQTDGYRTTTGNHRPSVISVRFYSVEVWKEQELVAGEIGYTVGDRIYTSLTGFSKQDSAGTVQLATWGALLIHWQFVCWDLGMDMLYKQRLGGRNVGRAQFLALLHQWRREPSRTIDDDSPPSLPRTFSSTLPPWPIRQQMEPILCRDVIDAIPPLASR